MNVDEVNACKSGYKPMDIYNSNAVVKQAIDTLQYGINGQQFNEIADSLKNSTHTWLSRTSILTRRHRLTL